ncbi:MAG TPA: isochorismatase family protein [Vicinamibacterales bacterium]|nr:isochorismatase family protein [Vicinamibacterales bacterium]
MTVDPAQVLRDGDALILVDVQRDFCPGGALPIEHGDAVVPVLNAWTRAAAAAGVPIYASRDWHPTRHPSFAAFGGKWPVHCLQDTEGAAFHPDLALPEEAVVVTKGTRFDQDQNSAFDQTGLAAELSRRGVRRLWIGGLAQDVCVLATVLDARREGFEVHVISDATAPVTPGGGAAACDAMHHAGARLVTTTR